MNYPPHQCPGAVMLEDSLTRFRVWAPTARNVELCLLQPHEESVQLDSTQRGYYEKTIPGISAGDRYMYRLDNNPLRPDPASRSQPEGVHEASEVVSSGFAWTDQNWLNAPVRDHIFYELHVGTFTSEGTFEAVIDKLDHLCKLGVTAIELMPVAQFPGGRNWGYDGVNLYAAQNTYGGITGLKKLVNACHKKRLAVILDVVYNHLGPEGNYLPEFGPYFTSRYHTPWGAALNFDGPYSDEVRSFFIYNAIYWINECHIDGLRLDAVHAIVDSSPLTFVEELASVVHREADRLGRRVLVISESAANDPGLLKSCQQHGIGMDAQWNDDYHHIVHALLTNERDGYYASYDHPRQLMNAMQDGFVYTGQWSAFHNRRHGRPTRGIAPSKFIVFSQNHDQVGNRMHGERLCELVEFESARLAAGLVVLSPNVPLLFMGEEFASSSPFLYFVSHGDQKLVHAVREGRKEEFAQFAWSGDPPDPQDEETFIHSRLNWHIESCNQSMFEFYRELINLRRTVPSLRVADDTCLSIDLFNDNSTLLLRRAIGHDESIVIFNLCSQELRIHTHLEGCLWKRVIDSNDTRWGGRGLVSLPEIHPAETPHQNCPKEIRVGPRAVVAYVRGES